MRVNFFEERIMNIEFAHRIMNLPPYVFAEMEKLILEKKRQGIDLISLSIGDPDLPPPPFILELLRKEASNQKNHNYSFSQGEPYFRQAVAEWYKKRFHVDLNSEKEVIALIGSKEGIANIARAFINPGDRVLVPDPAYPVYANGSTLLSDGVPVLMPLLEKNSFKPQIEEITGSPKMMFLNYPNNPTGATVDKAFLQQMIEFAKENNIIVCYDNAYSEIAFDGYKAPSILEIDGALEVAIEFHSCSKTFNMTGDRIAFAVGNRQLISGITQVKSQIDSGPPVYIQKVAANALNSYNSDEQPDFLKRINNIYMERRNVLIEHLISMGFKCDRPKATFYVWLNCGCNSMEFMSKLLDAGVIITPGVGFGKYGEKYVRISITQPKEKIIEACERMAKIL